MENASAVQLAVQQEFTAERVQMNSGSIEFGVLFLGVCFAEGELVSRRVACLRCVGWCFGVGVFAVNVVERVHVGESVIAS